MPYSIVKRKNKYYVQNDDSGDLKPEGGYGTHEEALNYQRALYSHVDDADKSLDGAIRTPDVVYKAVLAQTNNQLAAELAANGAQAKARFVGLKSVDDDGATVAGWALMFTDPVHPDLVGTYFPPESAPSLLLDYYTNAPLFFEHGKSALGWQPIGERTAFKVYPFGVWLEHRLYPEVPGYAERVSNIQSGKYGYSSDSIEHFVLQGLDQRDGALYAWPMVGCSLTDKPAEPGLGPVTLGEFTAAMKSVSGAREAHGAKALQPQQRFSGQKDMDQNEVLSNLAEFLGLDPGSASPEDVHNAVQQYCAQLMGDGQSPPELLDAMALPAGTPAEAAAGHLKELSKAVTGIDGDGSQAPAQPATDRPVQVAQPTAKPGVPGKAAPMVQAQPMMALEQEEPAEIQRGQGQDVPGYAGIQNFGSLRAAYAALGRQSLRAANEQADQLPSPYAYASRRSVPASGAVGRKDGFRGGIPYMTQGRGDVRDYSTRSTFGNQGQFAINKGAQNRPLTEMVQTMIANRMGQGGQWARKAMSYATGPTGGYILTQEMSTEILDPLRATAQVFNAGAKIEDLDGTQSKIIPAMNVAPPAYWPGENQAQVDGQPSYRTVTLYPKPLAALVLRPFSFIDNMMPTAETQLRQELTVSLQLEVDRAALVGVGAAVDSNNQGEQILGILNTPGVTSVQLGASDPVVNNNGRVPTLKDLQGAEKQLNGLNVPMQGHKRGWLWSSRTNGTFAGMTDTLGRPIFRQDWNADAQNLKPLGYPAFIDNNIVNTNTVGTSTTCSNIFFADWRYLCVGMTTKVELVLDQTFARNLMQGILAYLYVDVKVLYPQAFYVLTGALDA